jgi:hypothetical protein
MALSAWIWLKKCRHFSNPGQNPGGLEWAEWNLAFIRPLLSIQYQIWFIFLQENGIRTTKKNCEVVEQSDIIIIAVKPNIVAPVLREVAPVVTKKHLFMSIAAGVTIQSMEKVSTVP